jgi:hypothetical protein
MKTITGHIARGGRLGAGVTFAALAVMLAAGGARSAATHGDQPRILVTEAQVLFPDAPDGVDPMTTGPVSASFKARQAEAGCAEAAWPDIPAACYPR